MKKPCLALIILFCICSNAQSSVVDWINKNAITLEDSISNNHLIKLDQESFPQFNNVRIFGFGEATHHAKEFFEIKASFLKYLVQKRGVTSFVMEESYYVEKGLNEWLNGGDGDITAIVKGFSQPPWKSKEVVELFMWIKEYNQDKEAKHRVQFYGMDSQLGTEINVELRRFVTKHGISIGEDLLQAADSSSNYRTNFKPNTWASQQLRNLDLIKNLIQAHQVRSASKNDPEYNKIFRALEYLQNYMQYAAKPTTEVRDEQMFKNVIYTIQNLEYSGNVFLWAHNEHINKQGHSKGIINLGNRLKNHFGQAYYCVGFDFGKGTLRGLVLKSKKKYSWEKHKLNEPYKNTFAATLIKAKSQIYFLDMMIAFKTETTKFFEVEQKHLSAGGPGFNPKKPIFIKRSYFDAYDALIFVNTITDANYKL
jgi:erythromycin esterase